MIIRRLFNSSLKLTNPKISSCLTIPFCWFSEHSPVEVENRKQLLNNTLKQVNMLRQSSIFMGQEEQMQARKKRSLSKQQKLKLGLYIPKMPLNPRMGVESQLTYRQDLCQNLYQQQRTNLPTGVRILQKQTDSQHFTLDKYINTVYKDIYARYLVNKGIGVEWKGRYASYGILNSTSLSPAPTSLVKNFIKANIDSIQKVQSIAPYSYLTQSFIPTDLIEVQNIRKIGHYIKFPLTEFGNHEKNFQKLKQRQSKVQLLVFCQFLEKLINPHCLCVIPGQKMIILKRFFVQNSLKNTQLNPKQPQLKQPQSETQKGLRFEYLITSLQIFNKHKEYFTNKKYQKHSFFQSDHLEGMKALYTLSLNQDDEVKEISLPIMSQIEGYERDPGIYVVNGSTSIPDYERLQQLRAQAGNVDKLFNVLDRNGKLNLPKATKNAQNKQVENEDSHQYKNKQQQVSISIIDIEFQQKLLKLLKQQLNFQQLYDVFEDQVYSNKQSKQVLRFRLFDKYQIPINPESYNTLTDYFSSRSDELVLHESKVKLQSSKEFKKPRDRRIHKKQVRQSLKQRTEYMNLQESINSISNIPISGSTKGDLKVWLQKDNEGQIVQVYETLNEVESNKKDNFEEITISSDLISAISFLHNTQHQHDLNSVIIEPQTFTEEILPLCLHLTLFKTKQQPTKRGRKSPKSEPSLAKKLLESLKMIYLHPTIKHGQRDIEVHNFITGSLKISNKQDYGFGFEAIRLWVCRHSTYLGDRQLKEKQVNEELNSCTFIRKLYAEIIPLLPKNQLSQSLSQIQFNQLNFLDRFMYEQIDAYILNMEYFYSKIMLKQAYEYTMDFFKNVVEEIFVSTVRHHIITYPNEKENLSHGVTVRRLLQLLSVIAPLFPFSSFHISKTNIMKWPEVQNSQTFYKSLLEYNALIKIRSALRNKLELNKFSHCEVVFPISDTISYSQEDLKKFFGVDKISFVEPEVREKQFGLKLRFNQTLGGKTKISVHESKDHCIRCDPHSKQKEHLCLTCTEYLEKNIGKEIEFYDRRNMPLPDKGSTEEKQIDRERV